MLKSVLRFFNLYWSVQRQTNQPRLENHESGIKMLWTLAARYPFYERMVSVEKDEPHFNF